MSIILPNGGTISPCTLEGFNEVARKLRENEPIVTQAIDSDGTVTETVLWHPDDPPIDFAKLRAGYPSPPPSFLERVVVRIRRVLGMNRRRSR